MNEVDTLKERVEKLESELTELREQIAQLSKLLTEERKARDNNSRRRPKKRIVVGPSELIQLPEIGPSEPRPGDPQCGNRTQIL